MLTTWNIPLKIRGICQYSTYSMPFIVRSAEASSLVVAGMTLLVRTTCHLHHLTVLYRSCSPYIRVVTASTYGCKGYHASWRLNGVVNFYIQCWVNRHLEPWSHHPLWSSRVCSYCTVNTGLDVTTISHAKVKPPDKNRKAVWRLSIEPQDTGKKNACLTCSHIPNPPLACDIEKRRYSRSYDEAIHLC